jgi:hypothetical protein
MKETFMLWYKSDSRIVVETIDEQTCTFDWKRNGWVELGPKEEKELHWGGDLYSQWGVYVNHEWCPLFSPTTREEDRLKKQLAKYSQMLTDMADEIIALKGLVGEGGSNFPQAKTINGLLLCNNWRSVLKEAGYKIQGSENIGLGETDSCDVDAYEHPDFIQIYPKEKRVVAVFL